MNGKTSTNLGKQQIKSLSELNQYNMEPTITDNRTVAKSRSSFLARCTVACFSLLAFLLIGNSQMMAQCGMSQSSPVDTFFLDANCQFDATLIASFSAIGSPCDTSVISTDLNDLDGSIRSSIFDGSDIPNSPLTVYVRSTNGTDTSEFSVTLMLYIIDNTPPTVDITPSDTIVYCSDWTVDLDGTSAEIIAELLANGIIVDIDDNCGVQDTVIMVDTLFGFDGSCENDSIVARVRFTIIVTDIAMPVNTSFDTIIVSFADTSLPVIQNPALQTANAQCDDDFSAINIDTAALDILTTECSLVDPDSFDFSLVQVLDSTTQGSSPDSCNFYNYEIIRGYVVQRSCPATPTIYESVDTAFFIIFVSDTQAPVVDSALLEDAVTFTNTGDSTNVDSSTATITAQANNVDADSFACLACIEIDLAVDGFITDNCADFQNLLILYSRTFVGGDSLGYPDPDTLKQRGDLDATVDTCYAIGISTVAFTIVDACLNATEYVITIEVLDLDAPIIEGCPLDMVVEALEGDCSRIVEWLPPTADDCSGVEDSLWAVGPYGQELIILGPTGDGEWYAEFTVGVNTVYHQFVDSFGNADTCIFTVTVIDTQTPEVVAEDTITVQLDTAGMATIVESDFIISIDDNCQALDPTVFAPSTFTCEDLGPNDVTVTVSDTSGNDTTFIVVVIVEDNMAPFLVGGCDDIIASYEGTCEDPAGDCTVNLAQEIVAPMFEDNCTVSTVEGARSDGDDLSDPYPVGITTITWTATDQSGNTAQCVQQVIVMDNEAPQVQQLPNIELLLSIENEDGCNANATWPDPIITDCSDYIVSQTNASGDLFGLGVSIVQYTVTDFYGNSCNMSFTVTVIDDVAPVITCQASPYVVQSICDSIPLPDVTVLTNASDNCSGVLTYTQDPAAGTLLVDIFGPGNVEDGATATIDVIVTDVAGNSDTCEITIVLQDLDRPVPAVAELDSITPWLTPGASCGSYALEAPEAFDCQGNVIYGVPPSFQNVTFIPGAPPVYVFPAQNQYPGQPDSTYYAVQWTYTSPSSGLSSTQLQIVIVISDEVAPVLTCPADLTLGTSEDVEGDCMVNITDAGYDISMSFGEAPTVLPIPTPDPGFVNDNCEVVSIWYNVFSNNAGMVIYTDTIHLADGDSTIDAGDNIFEAGSYVITYYAEDGSGWIGSCSFNVVVEDDEDPIVEVCPEDVAFDIVVNEQDGGCSYTISGANLASVTPAFSDNCVIADTAWSIVALGVGSATPASGSGTLLGVEFDITGSPMGSEDFEVTFTVTDTAGNVSDPCVFIITINDATDPFIVCAADATRAANDVTVGDGLACVYVAEGGEFDPVVTFDNCDIASVTHDYVGAPSNTTLDGAIFPLDPNADSENPSVYTVTWTIVDNAGNESSCEIEITIVDESDPVWDYVWNINGLTCGDTLDLLVTDTDCEVFFEWMRPGNQNVEDCTEFSITENITESIANFNAQFNVNQLFGVYDQNNPNLVSVNLPHGLTTFTYIATDAFGNTAVCEFYVNVIDNVPPVVTCPSGAAITSICDSFEIPTYNFASVEDNCPLTITQDPVPGTTLGQIAMDQGIALVPGAMFAVTLTATDLQGNSASCTFMVTLSDTEFPVPSVGVSGGFLAPVTPETFAGASCGSIILQAPVSTTCDQTIYGVPSQSNGLVPGSNPPAYYFNSATFAPGVQITWTYTNTQNGNAVQQLQFIQVIDDEVEPTVNVFFDGFAAGGFTLGTSDDGMGDCEVNPDDAGVNWTVTANSNQYAFNVPDPQEGEAIDNCGVVALWYTVAFADGTSTTSDTSMVSVNPAVETYPLGVSTVTVYAADAAGNVGSASFTVTVVDDEDPSLTCPGNLTRAVTSSGCSYTVGVNDITVSATDNCSAGGDLVYEWFIFTAVPGATATPNEGTGNSLQGVVFDISGTEGGAASFSVFYFVTDEAGNEDLCIFNVLVQDLTPPTIVCAANATVGLDDEFTCGHTVSGTGFDPQFADNCDVFSVVNNYTGTNTLNGAFFPLLNQSGSTSYNVVWTVTDNFGNTATCTMVITVSDDQDPVWTGYDPQDVTLFTNQTDCEALYVWNRPTVSDVFECSDFSIAENINNSNVFHNVNTTFGVYNDEIGGQVIALFPVGQTVVSYTSTDVNGNATTVSFTVTVIDNIPPTIACQGPQMIPSICPSVQVPDYTGLGVVNDNCSNFTVTQTPAPGTLLSNLGVNLVNGATFNVTLTVTDDNNGLTDDCTFTVTLMDNAVPVPTVQVLPTINPTNTLAAGCLPFELPRPTATTCFEGTIVGVATITSPNVLTDSSVIFNQAGTYVLVWTYVDGPNTSNQTQIVTVTADQIAPSVECPADFTVGTDEGECYATVNLNLLNGAQLTASNLAEYNTQVAALLPGQYIDNCGASYTYTVDGVTYAPGSDPLELSVGSHTVTYTVTDGVGQSVSCNMVVTVTDNQNPVLDCVESLIVYFDEDGMATISVDDVLNTPASDNCGIASVVLSQSEFNCMGQPTPLFSYSHDFTQTFTVSGWTGTGFFRNAPSSTANPNLLPCVGIAAARRNFWSSGQTGLLTSPNLTIVSSEPASVSFAYKIVDFASATGHQPTTGNWGEMNVEYSTDGGTNWTTFYTIDQDNHAPSASCATVSTVIPGEALNTGQLQLRWSGQWFAGDYYFFVDDVQINQAFAFNNVVTVTATDINGNTSTCQVNVVGYDNIAPSIDCPETGGDGILVTLNTSDDGMDDCSSEFSWTHPEASDNCVLASYTVSYKNPDGSVEGESVVPGASATRVFDGGITTVTYTAVDNSGNVTTCSFGVEVVDDESPVFVDYLCGQTIQVNNLPGDCFNNVQWNRPSFANLSDNCVLNTIVEVTEEISNPDVLIIPPFSGADGGLAFAAFPVGVTTITYTATDITGNSAVCVVSIEVIDTEAPTISCPGSYTFPSVCPGELFVDLTAIASVDDNCDNYIVTQSPAAGMTLSQILGGASNVVVGASFDVTFTITDSYGNSASCVTTVTLQNIQSPIPTVGVDGGVLPALTPTTDIATTCSPYLVHAPTATANCGADTIIGTLSAGGAGVTPIGDFPFQSYWFEAGNYTITWVYNDGNTNTPNASQVQVIQITNDNIAPKVTCPANVVISAEEGLCSYTGVMNIGLTGVNFANLPNFNAFTPAPGQFADNCGATVQYSLSGATTVSLTSGVNAGVQTFNVGVTTVTYVVTDAAGNSASCNFTVTVTDDEAPMFAACPEEEEPEVPVGPTTVTATWAPGAFVNEVGVEVIRLSNNQVVFCLAPGAFPAAGTVFTLTDLPDGTYEVRGFDSFGDGWNGGSFTFTGNGQVVFTTTGPPNAGFSPSGNICDGVPSSVAAPGASILGTFTLPPVPAPPAPPLVSGNGTTCAEAIVLNSGSTVVSGTTTGNPLASVPFCGTSLTTASTEWYALQNFTGPVTISTCGTATWDTKLGVFSGLSCAQLTCVTGNDDACGLQSQVSFFADPSQTYFVLVTGFGSANGAYSLTITAPETPTTPPGPDAEIVVNTDPGQCYTTAPVEVLDVTDNCGVVSFTVVVENEDSGVVFSGNVSTLPASLQWPLGINTVTFTATDAAGNSATCGYSVAVIDEEVPVIACPEVQEIEVGPSFQATVEGANPIAPAGFYNIFYPVEVPASLTGLYTVTVSYNGTSGALSWRNEYFSMIIGPDGETYFNAQPTPLAFTGPIVGTFNLGLVSNPAGTWQIWAGDAFGDFTFDVDVTLSFEPVVFPGALAVLNTSDDGYGDCSTSYTWNHPAASDNCVFEYTVSYQNPDGSTEGPFVVMSGASATRVFDQGTTVVMYTATDISGNETTCEFSIVVVDNEPPTAICDPISITLNPVGIAIVTPSVIENNINDGSYDNCPGQLTYWLDQVMFTCADIGVNPIRLYVMDATGNISICNTTITVLDNNLAANPVWPADITITNCQNPQNLSLTGMVTGDSPCGNAGTYVDVIIPGNCPGNYVIQRNWTVLDAAGIPSTHTQIITVVDNQGPTFSGVPSNITLTSCEGLAALIATPGNVQAVDCPGNTTTLPITYTTAISACSAGSYTITRTWLATDACGNSSTATQVITVIDNQAPVITGPSAITLNVSDYDVTTCVSSVDLIVTVTDCNLAGPTVVTNSFNAGGTNASGIYPVGTTSVVFTATDACGNSSTHTAVVTVVDDVNPVAICFESFNVVLNNQGIGTIFPWELDNGSYDNCQNISLFLFEVGQTSHTFTCEDLGPQPVPLVVVDASGNINVCTTIVNVMANSADQLEVTVVTTNVTAVGGNDGTATAVVIGGSGNYAYWWSNGGTTQTISGLAAGVYSVTVSDLNPANCATAEGSGEVMGGAPITFHVGSAAGAVGDIVQVPVSVENFANILGFQFTIDVVDPSIGQIVGFSNFGLPGLTGANFNPATGTVSWVNNLPQAVTLADGTVIFHIQVQLVGGMTGSSSDVVIISNPLALEVIQEQGGLAVQIPAADVVTTDGEVVITQGLSGPFAIGGNIITENGLPVALVHVALTGDVMESMTTTTNGMYFFDEIPLGSDVTVTPSKDVNHLNGITTFDAVLLQRHLIGTQILGSPYKKIAADIDSDGMLTIGDLIQLRRVILLIDNDFVNPFTGLKNNTSWRFALPGLTDPAPASMIVPTYTEARDYMNLSADFIADHYIGVKIGDLNNSVSPNALAPETGDNAHPANYRSTLAMVVNDVDYKAGETFTVDFMAKDFVDVAGYQFTFNFDAAQLNFAGVEAGDLRNLSADNFGLTFIEEGAVTVSWNDIDADLQNDAVLFSITFEAIANGTLSNAIDITSELIRVEGYRSNGEFMDITIQYTGGIATRGEFILYQNEPNPFVSETRIGFELPEAANGTLNIFDGTGRLLRSYPGKFVQGYNVISVERGDLPVSGVLYYQLSTPTHSATKKMILAQ